MDLKERDYQRVAPINFRATVAVLCALFSAYASALTVSPSPSSTGSYTVVSTMSLTIQEKVGSGNFTTVCSYCYSKAFSGKPVGTYQYRTGVSYYWGGWQWSTVEGPVSVQVVPNVPNVPGPINAPSTDNDGAYTVSWGAATGAATYQLLERPNGIPTWAEVQNTSALIKAFSGKTSNSYYYVVRACNTSGCSAYAAQKTVVVSLLQPPGVPGAISTPATDNNGAWTTSWGAASGTVDTYTLEESTNGGQSWSVAQNTAALSKAFSGKGNGVYTFRVKACNGAGCGGWTSNAATINALTPGVPPSLASPTTSSNGTFTVTWGTASGTISAYELEERVGGGGWSNIHNSTGLSKARSALNDGVYDYIIRACNTVSTYKSCSAYSAATTTMVAHAPGTTGAPTVSPSPSASGSYTVSWTAPTGNITKYQAEERPLGGSWINIANANVLSAARAGLGSGTYEYQVRACNQVSTFLSCGGYSATGQGTVEGVPGVPANMGGHTWDTGGSWDLSWNAAGGMVDTYELEERYNGSGAWTTTVITHPTIAHTYSGKAHGTYEYRVRACNGMGCSAYSTPLHTLNSAARPPVPASITPTPTTSANGTINVSWPTVSPPVTAYKLEELVSGNWTEVSSGLATTHQRTGLADGTYNYKVRACNTVGTFPACSDYGTQSTNVTVLYAPGVPAAVVMPPSPDVDGDYTVSWSAASGQVANYEVQQSSDGGSNWSTPFVPVGTTQSYNNQPEGTFTYRVRACNTSGCGGYQVASASVTVDVPAGSGGGNGDPNGIFTVDPNPTAYEPGLMPGEFSVDGGGSASYNVPIAVPPGTAGMQPSLSFIYDSRRGNGLLGIGWSLGGFSVVTRCGSTKAHDGTVDGIDFDAGDRFCLEGEKLMLVSGTYGADGAEYRTEIDGFTKVVSKGVTGSGPAWFEVHTKSGQRMEYGNSADSRIEANGRSEARLWAVNKIADTAGNHLTLAYEENTTATGTGGYRPDRIDYTGNTNAPATATYASVEFEYEARPDLTPNFYLSGSIFSVAERLSHVKTYNGATLVRDYRLSYGENGVNDASRVIEVKECDAAGACFPPTAFAWEGSGTDAVLSNQINNDSTLSKYNFIAGDWNGDGRTDVFLQNKNLTGTSKMYTANTRGIMVATGWNPTDFYLGAASTSPPVPKHVLLTGDWNGDGKTDLARVTHTFWTSSWDGGTYFDLELYTSNGTSMTLVSGSFIRLNSYGNLMINEENSDKIVFGDWNGDGRTDMLHYAR